MQPIEKEEFTMTTQSVLWHSTRTRLDDGVFKLVMQWVGSVLQRVRSAFRGVPLGADGHNT